MGRLGIEIAPANTINRAQTVANTGRWIKKSTNTRALRQTKILWDAGHVQGM
jgi:hypothetical protein